MSEFSIDALDIKTVSFDGKIYTCNGDRRIVDGNVMYVYKTRNGLDYDVLLCSDRNPDSGSEFIHSVTIPGQTSVLEPVEVEQDHYLTFEAVLDGGTNIWLDYFDSFDGPVPEGNSYEYSVDGGKTWQAYSFSKNGSYSIGETVSLEKPGDTVKFRGTSVSFSDPGGSMFTFKIDRPVKCYGDLTSIFNRTGGEFDLNEMTGYYRTVAGLFDGAQILTLPNLPFKNLTAGMFTSTFSRTLVSSISETDLPFTELPEYCYSMTFLECTNLRCVHLLPAETLSAGCYNSMFQECTNLEILSVAFTEFPHDGEHYTSTGSWLEDAGVYGAVFRWDGATELQDRGRDTVPEVWRIVPLNP